MKISYGITVNNELDELRRLLTFLVKHKRKEDEIVVLQDSTNTNDGVLSYLDAMLNAGDIQQHSLKKLENNFAQFKNYLKSMCTGEYIVQLDADEIPHENLVQHLPDVLEMNDDVELFVVSRVNTVDGLTDADVKRWGWQVNDKGWVNFPDFQMRIMKNTDNIKWEGKVHEKIVGFKTFTPLPAGEEWALYHPKTIERQRKQNDYYETLM